MKIEKAIAWYKGKIDESINFINKGNVCEKMILQVADNIREYRTKIQGLEYSKSMWCE